MNPRFTVSFNRVLLVLPLPFFAMGIALNNRIIEFIFISFLEGTRSISVVSPFRETFNVGTPYVPNSAGRRVISPTEFLGTRYAPILRARGNSSFMENSIGTSNAQ